VTKDFIVECYNPNACTEITPTFITPFVGAQSVNVNPAVGLSTGELHFRPIGPNTPDPANSGGIADPFYAYAPLGLAVTDDITLTLFQEDSSGNLYSLANPGNGTIINQATQTCAQAYNQCGTVTTSTAFQPGPFLSTWKRSNAVWASGALGAGVGNGGYTGLSAGEYYLHAVYEDGNDCEFVTGPYTVAPCGGGSNLGAGSWLGMGTTLIIPDLNFEIALFQNGVDNVNPNTGTNIGWVPCCGPSNVCGTTTLDLYDKYICDLTGLEAFYNLTWLDVSWNGTSLCDINSIPTSTLHNLEYLKAQFGSIQQGGLDLTNCTALEYLDLESNTAWSGPAGCGSNLLTDLDLTQNTLLQTINLAGTNVGYRGSCTLNPTPNVVVDVSSNSGTLTSLSLSVQAQVVDLGTNVDLNNLAFGGGQNSMIVHVGTTARVTQANTLLANGGGNFTWSIPLNTTFTQ
jgi:hypothetical protein